MSAQVRTIFEAIQRAGRGLDPRDMEGPIKEQESDLLHQHYLKIWRFTGGLLCHSKLSVNLPIQVIVGTGSQLSPVGNVP